MILAGRTIQSAIILIPLILPLPVTAEASEEATVMAITQAACEAVLRGDIAELERLLTPDFTLVGSDASIQTREQLLDEVRSGEPVYEVFRNHSMSARIHGDAAVVHGITTLKGSANGSPFSIDVRFTDTLIRMDGKWRMVTSHVTRIPSN